MRLFSMVRVVIIDDQPGTLEDVRLQMEQHPDFIVVGVCRSLKEALVIIPNTQPKRPSSITSGLQVCFA